MALCSMFKVLLQCSLETSTLLQNVFVSLLSNSGNVGRFSSSLWLCPHFSTNTVLSNQDYKKIYGPARLLSWLERPSVLQKVVLLVEVGLLGVLLVLITS